MLDEWGNEIKTGVIHDYKVIAINDLEPEWKGKVSLRIYDNDKVLSEYSVDIVIPSFGKAESKISLVSPESPGTYFVVASLERGNDKPVRSIREIPFK